MSEIPVQLEYAGVTSCVEPSVWIGDSRSVPGDDFDGDWLAYLEQDPVGSRSLNPELSVSLSTGSEEAALVYACWGNGDKTDPLDSFAVLLRKAIRIPLLPMLGGMTLHGLRLAGSRLQGDNGERSVESFVETVATVLSSRRFDCLLIEDLEVDSALWKALTEADPKRRMVTFYPGKAQPHWWIEFPAPAEDFWKGFSGKTRNTLQRKAKKFEHRLLCFREKQDIPTLLEKAHQVSARSWQSRSLGLRIANTPGERRFWEYVASRGALRSYVLEHQDVPVAFVLGIQWGDNFLYEEAAHDRMYSKQSPGTVLLYRILQDLLDRDTPRCVDFGFGDGEHKRLFGNRQTTSGPVLLVRRSFRTLFPLKVNQFRNVLTQTARRVLAGSSVVKLLRRLRRR